MPPRFQVRKPLLKPRKNLQPRKAEWSEYERLRKRAVKLDYRVNFGIMWFKFEKDAERLSELNKILGRTKIGGTFEGELCKRNRAQDYVDENGRKLYACEY